MRDYPAILRTAAKAVRSVIDAASDRVANPRSSKPEPGAPASILAVSITHYLSINKGPNRAARRPRGTHWFNKVYMRRMIRRRHKLAFESRRRNWCCR